MIRTITLHYPSETLPVSLTGQKCELNCKHCGGFYLKSMAKLPEISRKNWESLLISGGCDQHGEVPIMENAEKLRDLRRKGYRLNIHTGLMRLEYFSGISSIANVVSFDFILDDHTIKEVYGLDAKGEDYKRAFFELNNILPVVPHITLGILGGKMKGERAALEELAAMGVTGIVFLVFIPTRGTVYEKMKPPGLEEVDEILELARKLMPETRMGLGCMHPKGDYREKLEGICYKHGFDSFVNPSRKFRNFLEKEAERVNGDGKAPFEIKISRECCAFDKSIGWNRKGSGL